MGHQSVRVAQVWKLQLHPQRYAQAWERAQVNGTAGFSSDPPQQIQEKLSSTFVMLLSRDASAANPPKSTAEPKLALLC